MPLGVQYRILKSMYSILAKPKEVEPINLNFYMTNKTLFSVLITNTHKQQNIEIKRIRASIKGILSF